MKRIKLYVENASPIINVILTILLVVSNVQLVKISSLKYKLENRPYVSIESLNWIDEFPSLFSVSVKNPGNFPAKTTLEILITDIEGREIMKESAGEFILFPYYESADITINQGFSLTQKNDDSKTLIFSSKDSQKAKDILDAGEIIEVSISANYSSLVEDIQFSKKYHYSQNFLLKKQSGSIIIKPTKKIDAN